MAFVRQLPGYDNFNNKTLNMAKQIFINLAVKDLKQSMDFYRALGFTVNPQFSDHTATCMVWSDSIFVMLLTHEKFSSFTNKPIADTKSAVAGLFSLSVDSVEEVNRIVQAGLAAGGYREQPPRPIGTAMAGQLSILRSMPRRFADRLR